MSSLLSLTTKIVNCLHTFQRNVFLEEKRNALDCSCILTSLAKICLHSRYRTVIGLENLIQKEWFLAGHMFYKRMSTHKRSRTGSDEFSLQSNNSSNNLNDNNDLGSDSMSANDSTGGGGSEIAPTFLLFLDCLFQLTQQYANEFEFNEFYLIKLWDYACSGLAITYSFNGMADWLNYLNNQKFLDNSSSNFPIVDSISMTTTTTASMTLPRGSLPKFENVYLKLLFESSNKFWAEECLAAPLANELSNWKNKNFKPQLNTLMPVERLYMLKFWSRCYLRWYEKYHAYNETVCSTTVAEITTTTAINGNETPRMQPSRPPPLPPKPKNLLKQNSTTNAFITNSLNAADISPSSSTDTGAIQLERDEDFEELTAL